MARARSLRTRTLHTGHDQTEAHVSTPPHAPERGRSVPSAFQAPSRTVNVGSSDTRTRPQRRARSRSLRGRHHSRSWYSSRRRLTRSDSGGVQLPVVASQSHVISGVSVRSKVVCEYPRPRASLGAVARSRARRCCRDCVSTGGHLGGRHQAAGASGGHRLSRGAQGGAGRRPPPPRRPGPVRALGGHPGPCWAGPARNGTGYAPAGRSARFAPRVELVTDRRMAGRVGRPTRAETIGGAWPSERTRKRDVQQGVVPHERTPVT